MKRWFSFMMLAFAMLLALAHALVPHQHLEVNPTTKHVEAHEKVDSFLDFLALGFHHEQYDGQQETYLQGEDASVDLDSFGFVAHFALLHFEIIFIPENTSRFAVLYTEVFPQEHHHNTPDLRGPPVLS